ncbi:hypothetical protein BS103_13420 [Acinetobacter baumannii]|nr:hypothetical protein BS103_13420 [Acinetobacter baumannii]
MKISNNLLNNNLWRRIERIKNLSDRYKTAAEYRLKDISHEKPVGIKISGACKLFCVSSIFYK